MLVAAIDFGTTYSGYAFSFKYDWRKVHVQAIFNDKFVSSKAPTKLLLNPDKSFCAFGYGAENMFMDVATEYSSDSDSDSDSEKETKTKPKKDWKEHYFFQRFKMLLHSDQVRNRRLK